jgi:hypothetical protein
MPFVSSSKAGRTHDLLNGAKLLITGNNARLNQELVAALHVERGLLFHGLQKHCWGLGSNFLTDRGIRQLT